MDSRWRKLVSDARAERGRLALMVTAITVSLAGVGAVLGAWGVLDREIAVNYLGTHPAEATLEFEGGVDARVLGLARADPAVRVADAREVALARVQVGHDHRPLLLFVPDAFETLALNTFRPERGAWPPPLGSVLLERSALGMAQADVGGRLTVKTPNGAPREVGVAGVVHDPGLAPAWQEREVYAYATRETLAWLGEAPVLHELRVTFRTPPADVAAAQREAEALAARLSAQGATPHELRVPPPRQHPHQRQMMTVLTLLITFAALALVLSSVLVATSLSAMLARQVREIGVMKTLGAQTSQLAALYAVLVLAVGLGSVLASLPLAWVGTQAFASSVSKMLNFTLTSRAVPWWVGAVQVSAGLLVPPAFAAWPISRAIRISVRDALDSHGGARVPRAVSTWWPVPVRNVLRTPGRFALTTGLLATAGALFMTSLAVSRAWQANLDSMYQTRHYDVEVRFNHPERPEVAAGLNSVPGVQTVEAWGAAPAAFAHEGHFDVVRTYPDRGHGSLWVFGVPPATGLIAFPLVEGRWLEAADEHGVVLNHVARVQAGGAHVGDEVTLSFDGVRSKWHVVGVVEEIGSGAVAYTTETSFAAVTGSGDNRRLLRVASSADSAAARTEVVRRIEARLAAEAVSVEWVVPFTELRTAIADHIAILIQALLALATILAVVGMLGLTSAVGVSVLERSREIGVLKAMGATPARIRRLLLTESGVVAAVSWVVAVVASLPLTWAVDSLVGTLGFLAPLPFVLSWPAMGGWGALLVVGTLGATLPPVRRATAMTVREALVET